MRRLSWLVLVASFIAAGSMPVAMAQTQSGGQAYVVQQGDTLYVLKGIYSANQAEWKAFTILNPFLSEPGRAFVDREGRFIVLIRPGEKLEGIDRLGIEVEPVSVEQLKLVSAPAPKEAEVKLPAVANNRSFDWGWWFIVLTSAVLIGYFLYGVFQVMREKYIRSRRERELLQDPITSGPALVPGGIPATDTARLENFFEQQAVARYAERNPGIDRTTVRVERIGPVEAGTISGEGLVGYLGGQWRPRRIETPLQAYQARYRFPDATEEILQCLQACMNPVAGGGEVYRGFTFTAGQAVVPTPEPPAPVPEVVPHPAIAVRRIREAAQTEGHSTVTIGDRVITVERGVHFVVADDGSIMMTGVSFEMVVRPKTEAQPAITDQAAVQ